MKTHLRDMVIVPEMIGSIVGVYNGKTFNQVEIKVTYILYSLSRSIIQIGFVLGYKNNYWTSENYF